VSSLLMDGVDPNHKSDCGTPLICAIEQGNRQILLSLLVQSDINVNQPDLTGQTPLIAACKILCTTDSEKSTHNYLVKLLLDVSGIVVNALDQSGTPAIMYATLLGNLALVELLVEAGASINVKNSTGDTALHWAVVNEHTSLVHYFLSKGATIQTNSEGYTPSDKASSIAVIELFKGKYTSTSRPYQVDFIDDCSILNNSSIGMSMCPGRQNCRNWSRDLDMDIEVMKDHKVEIVVSLMTLTELQRMKLGHLFETIIRANMESMHFPITDKWLPKSIDGFIKIVQAVVDKIKLGKKIMIHCNGGKGRTGLLVVACLIQLGMSQTDATNKIRKTRPGMLQNPAQQMYLKMVENKLSVKKNIKNSMNVQ